MTSSKKSSSKSESPVESKKEASEVESKDTEIQDDTAVAESDEMLKNDSDNDTAEEFTDESQVEELSLEEIAEQDIPLEMEIEGDLVVKRKIGDGYYGPVYRVGDIGGNVDFAVKALPDQISGEKELLEKVQESFTKATFLNHPNIACVSYLHEIVEDSPMAKYSDRTPFGCSNLTRIDHAFLSLP